MNINKKLVVEEIFVLLLAFSAVTAFAFVNFSETKNQDKEKNQKLSN